MSLTDWLVGSVLSPRACPIGLCSTGMPGFTKGKKLNKMGLKAQDTSELFFEDVRLPKSALLGKENGGFYLLMSELPQERLLIAVMGLASAEAVYELTRKYVTERKAFGKTLKDLQVPRSHPWRCIVVNRCCHGARNSQFS